MIQKVDFPREMINVALVFERMLRLSVTDANLKRKDKDFTSKSDSDYQAKHF